MLTKTLYVIVDIIAIIDILFTIKAIAKVSAAYARWLRYTLIASIMAICANILVACSFSPLCAEVAYCFYFASIDWIIYFLTGFCLLYTEHDAAIKRLYLPAACIMGIDSVSLFANLILENHFSIYENTSGSVIFYQTSFHPMYFIHLAIDYIAIIIALSFIVYRIAKTYGMYRMKYVIILSVLLLVIVLNLAYMTLSLVLDASVVFYAVAGTLIYFCTEVYVPKKLMSTSVARAVDDMNEGLILFDISNNCIYANAFCSFRFDIDINNYDFTCEPVASVIKDLDSQGKRFGESSYVRSDGVITEYYKIKYTSLLDRHARSMGTYFLIQDTSEEKHYMAEIEEARIAADNANSAKSTFLANMSHEIRTPLNSVLGMNEMILRTSEDKEIREYAESIKTSGKTLLSLINEILDFSKIEAGRMDIIESEYNISQLIRDCYAFFEAPAASKDLYLNISFDEKIPMLLKGDALHIKQVITNLISNAVKYTKEGGVTMNVTENHIGNNRIELIIEVSDTGMGISDEDKPYLFESFKRVNEKENATIQGTGLGLAITKQLIAMMNGDITVDSIIGEGSSFKVVIPQDVASSMPSGPLILKHAPEEETYKESFRAPDAHILIVDDVLLNLKVACALLKKTLIKIDTATSGAEAISMCHKEKYDVILLDHRMPDKDGIETFKEISEKGLNKTTPVVMLTANALSGADEEYKHLGFSGYLSKPIDIKALEQTLIKLLPEDKVWQ